MCQCHLPTGKGLFLTELIQTLKLFLGSLWGSVVRIRTETGTQKADTGGQRVLRHCIQKVPADQREVTHIQLLSPVQSRPKLSLTFSLRPQAVGWWRKQGQEINNRSCISVMLFVFCPLSPLCLYALAKLQLGVFCDLMVLVKDDETDNNNNSSGWHLLSVSYLALPGSSLLILTIILDSRYQYYKQWFLERSCLLNASELPR